MWPLQVPKLVNGRRVPDMALAGAAFDCFSSAPDVRTAAYTRLNEYLDEQTAGGRATERHAQTAIVRTLGGATLKRLHADCASGSPALRTASCQLFCRILNLNAANVGVASDFGCAGTAMAGVFLVAVGATFRQQVQDLGSLRDVLQAAVSRSTDGVALPFQTTMWCLHYSAVATSSAGVRAVCVLLAVRPVLSLPSHTSSRCVTPDMQWLAGGVMQDPAECAVGYYDPVFFSALLAEALAAAPAISTVQPASTPARKPHTHKLPHLALDLTATGASSKRRLLLPRSSPVTTSESLKGDTTLGSEYTDDFTAPTAPTPGPESSKHSSGRDRDRDRDSGAPSRSVSPAEGVFPGGRAARPPSSQWKRRLLSEITTLQHTAHSLEADILTEQLARA
jgi:hypothetical protein